MNKKRSARKNNRKILEHNRLKPNRSMQDNKPKCLKFNRFISLLFHVHIYCSHYTCTAAAWQIKIDRSTCDFYRIATADFHYLFIIIKRNRTRVQYSPVFVIIYNYTFIISLSKDWVVQKDKPANVRTPHNAYQKKIITKVNGLLYVSVKNLLTF